MSLTKLVNSVPIVSVLALAACQGRPEKILIDYKFSQQEVNLIAEAQREWQEAADSSEMDIPLSVGFNSDEKPSGFLDQKRGSEAIIYKIESSNPGYATLKEESGSDLVGVSKVFTNIIFVEDKIKELVEKGVYTDYGGAFYRTALHEYGHFLGLDHLASSRSVMANLIYEGVETCIDPETLEYYCSINECGSNRHATCTSKK